MTGKQSSCGKCVRSECHKLTNMACDRCGDFYCSHACQSLDWKQHRYVCIKMASLRIVGEDPATRPNTADNATQASPAKSNGHENVAQAKTVTVQQELKTPQAVKNPVEVAPMRVEVKIVDKPVEAPPKPAEPAAASKLMGMSAIRRPQFKPPAPAAPKKTMLFDLKVRDFSGPKVKAVYLTLVDENIGNLMIVCEDIHYKEFLDMSTKIQTYCKDNKPGYEPEMHEVVLCHFKEDSMWYRAVVGQPKNDEGKYSVFFIDYGNVELVQSSEIIKLPDELKFDLISKTCHVLNAPKFAKDFTEAQVQVLMEESIDITDINEIKGAKGESERIDCKVVGF